MLYISCLGFRGRSAGCTKQSVKLMFLLRIMEAYFSIQIATISYKTTGRNIAVHERRHMTCRRPKYDWLDLDCFFGQGIPNHGYIPQFEEMKKGGFLIRLKLGNIRTPLEQLGAKETKISLFFVKYLEKKFRRKGM